MTLPPGPVGTAALPQVPHGRTAMRLDWKFLPAEVRALVETELGGTVVEAKSQESGFTPGFASLVTTETGARAFVKAASRVAQGEIAASYAEEARKRSLLGDAVPAPRLLWVHEDDAWVVLGFEAVDARQPHRPWRPAELDRALDLAEAIATSTETLPDGLDLRPAVEDLPQLVTGWDDVPEQWPHRDEAAALAASLRDLPADRFAHFDLRDDNVLLVADGRTLACDWNWPALGAVWQDTVDLLIAAHGDGLDVAPLFARRPLLDDAEPDHVDAWIAGMCGFMLSARTRPAPRTSPHLRTHTNWYAEAAWSLLATRRGWA